MLFVAPCKAKNTRTDGWMLSSALSPCFATALQSINFEMKVISAIFSKVL